MDQGAMVIYKEVSRKLAGICGIVEGTVQDKPDRVWVRWIGNSVQSEESVQDLEEV
jgi:hypothetical protein